jgi:hypothetical protein
VTGPEMGQRTNDGKPTSERLARWIDSVGNATLPLLAGFSTTAVVVVSDDGTNFRWPGPAILAFAIAAVVLIIAVQCAYHARIYLWSGRKQQEEREDRDVAPALPQNADPDDADTHDVTNQQDDRDYALGFRWTKATQLAYHIGIVALLVGLGLAVAPYHATGTRAGFQWLAAGLAFAACIGEAAAWVWQYIHS